MKKLWYIHNEEILLSKVREQTVDEHNVGKCQMYLAKLKKPDQMATGMENRSP